MERKVCNVCGCEKRLQDFSKRGGGKYAAFCKKCRSEKQKAKRKLDPSVAEKARERDRRWRERNPESAKESDFVKNKKYKERNRELLNEKQRIRGQVYRAENPERNREIQRRYRAENPDKFKEYDSKFSKQRASRQKVNYAVRVGKLTKPNRCQCCLTSGYVEAHHPDYDKPFDVSWLCKKCHHSIHVNQRRDST